MSGKIEKTHPAQIVIMVIASVFILATSVVVALSNHGVSRLPPIIAGLMMLFFAVDLLKEAYQKWRLNRISAPSSVSESDDTAQTQ